jgi:hypothetical protein
LNDFIEVIGWENAMAVVRALTHSNYEVLISSDEGISPWHDQRSERVYRIEYSHRDYEQGFEKLEEENE